MIWKISVQYEPEAPANTSQIELPVKETKAKKGNPKGEAERNILLEDAFKAVREKIGDNRFVKITIQRIET